MSPYRKEAKRGKFGNKKIEWIKRGQEKNRPRESSDWRADGKNPGGDLLLRDLSSDYHWRGSVSLPGSERDRVGPLRSGHRASGGRGDFFFILPAREPCFLGASE